MSSKYKHKIGNRLITIVGLLSTTAILTIILIFFFITLSNNIESRNKDINTLHTSYITFTDELIRNMKTYGQAISKNNDIVDSLDNNDYTKLPQALDRLLGENKTNLVFVTDRDGKIIFEGPNNKALVADKSYYKEIDKVLRGNIVETNSFNGTNNISYRITHPVYKNGQIIGSVGYGIEIGNQNLINKLTSNCVSDIFIFNNLDLIRYSKSTQTDKLTIANNSIPPKLYEQIKQGIVQNNVFTKDNEVLKISGNEFLGSIYSIKIDDQNIITFAFLQDKSIILDHLFKTMTIALIGGFLILIVLFIILSSFIKRNISKPINQITENAAMIADGNLSFELEDSKYDDEIANLKKSFNNLIKSTNKKIDIVNKLATGDISNINFKFKEQDELANSLKVVVNNLNGFRNNINLSQQKLVTGAYHEIVDTTDYQGIYKDILNDMNDVFNLFESQLYTLPTPLITTDLQGNIIYYNKAANVLFDFSDNLFSLDLYFNNLINKVINTKELVQDEIKINMDKELWLYISAKPLFNNNSLIGINFLMQDLTNIRKQQDKLEKQSKYQSQKVEGLLENIKYLSKGQFKLNFKNIPVTEDTLEISKIYSQIEDDLLLSANSIRLYVNDIKDKLNQLANNNLDIEVDLDYIGEFSVIKESLVTIINSFNNITSEITESTDIVFNSAKDINISSQKLSNGVTQQAAAVEEISATITQVSEQVNETSVRLKEVNDLALEAKESALLCDNLMQKMTMSMDEINSAAEVISKVLKLINDISFQTNILSLNAAVEAARAGAHGKGFAVIAEDVRNLALKSANAALETSDMINTIIKKIKIGTETTNETAIALLNILDHSNKVVDITNDVNVASSEQAAAVKQISLSIDQISQVINVTSVNAQEEAGLSKTLNDQALILKDITNQFNLKK